MAVLEDTVLEDAVGGGASEVVSARRAVALLRRALAVAPPEQVCGPDAAVLAGCFAQAERVAAAGKALYARRVKATGAYGSSGHHDAAGWLAQVGGESVAQARDELSCAEQVARVPRVHAAFAAGRLSRAQAKVIGEAAVLDPAAAPGLLDAARDGSFSDVRAAAEAVRRRARSEEDLEAQEARVHAGRYCRVSSPKAGGVRIEAWLTKREGARVLLRLEHEVEAIFAETAGAGPRERIRADALVRLVWGSGRHGSGRSGVGHSAPDAHVVVRADIGALLRGHLQGDEVCEIPGVGEVPVATARALLGDAFFNIVLRNGADVRCVTGTGRTIPTALRVALFERDRVCVVPGCAIAGHLEIDHWRTDFAHHGPTTLDNLARLCGPHHAMKTRTGWRLAGGPGKWRWIAPRPAAARRPTAVRRT